VKEDVQILILDLRNIKKIEKAVKKANVIFHLAAETHIDRSIRDHRPFIEANIIGIFKRARPNKSRKISDIPKNYSGIIHFTVSMHTLC
jgi:dTDP-D-glucose 4,6-dehydratase